MAQPNTNLCLGAANASIPAAAGIGLRSPHYRDALASPAKPAWLEVHSENYFGAGGAPLRILESLRRDYPLSLHGVGMSLGSADSLDWRHLRQLQQLIDRFEPALVSEHLSWSAFGGRYLNDLAPLAYTESALDEWGRRVSQAQDFLSRQLLLENPSSYLQFECGDYSEAEFLSQLARRSGCGILLDVNNLYLSCQNHGWDALDYLLSLDAERIAEFHLAGHSRNRVGTSFILIDSHNGPVAEPVWQLFRMVLQLVGSRPTLIEWDADLPDWQTLVGQAARADRYLRQSYVQAA
ncbi:MNIO family bufferin maturase [Methylomonas koyamae]|uniref:MNIO family bufferin maturase n=1 Tax=Methylomonas koyamae TaxID=702114 RepID=UPI0006D0BFDE|nr:DUF692 domain-containing protein [Methylomonas koyamae]BBL57998.1 hypothetical protein MKFW12EY_16110 [Methylomonas koyamae]